MKCPLTLAASLLAILSAGSASATPFSFTTGTPDGRVAMASRPDAGGKLEIETADDFILTDHTRLTGGTFTGLLPTDFSAADIQAVNVSIYRVFPLDSTDPPSGNVPSRVNSPSDVEFDSRESGAGGLTFSTQILNSSFSASNSVLNGIHPKPNQTTIGEGAVRGEEVQFDFDFATALNLDANHYYFVPQVELANGDFYWLSTGFGQFTGDLQTWMRNGDLDPDWLRVGTDIIGSADARNDASFSLRGGDPVVPEPASLTLVGLGLAAIARRRKRAGARDVA